MADGTTQSDNPDSLRAKAGRFLGSIPSGYASRDPGNPEGNDGSNGANARSVDARTIDPTEIASDAPKRRGRGKWTPEQHAADRARRGKSAGGPDAGENPKEEVAVEPPLPDPTILGFASEGLGFLNIVLAARLNAPEFLAISPDRSAMVAKAWLKFLGYYVSIAKATGPMGALAAALTATAFVYGPPAIMSLQRNRGQVTTQPEMAAHGPSEGAEAMFASAMPPVN